MIRTHNASIIIRKKKLFLTMSDKDLSSGFRTNAEGMGKSFLETLQ